MHKVLGFAKEGKTEGIFAVRCHWPLAALNRHPDFSCRVVSDRQLEIMAGDYRGLASYDLYVFPRIHAPGECPFEEMQARGVRFIYDTDDDLTGDHRDIGEAEAMRDTVEWCHAVTTSTPHLAGVMERYGKPVYCLPNYIDTSWYGKVSMATERQVKGLTIGLCGTSTHFFDWAIVVDALVRVKERHPEVTVVAIGYKPPFLDRVPGLEVLAPLPFQMYPGLLAQLDVRLCPLDAADPFTASKSDIAALEAMAASRKLGKRVGGAVPMGTDCNVYRDTIQHRQTGLLVKDGDWEAAIEEIVTDRALRRRLAIQGNRWVKANRDLVHGIPARAAAYKEILEGNNGK